MYVIYDIESTLLVGKTSGYKTYAAAKAGLTRYVNSLEPGEFVEYLTKDFAIADAVVFYTSIEKQETRENMMSGKEFKQGVNTPLCCDPSSETYWSM